MAVQIPDRYQPTGKKLPGGMGEVAVFKDTNLDRDVAIKILKDVTDITRVFDEIVALQQIRSIHVVEIYDVLYGSETGEIAIVEEYLPGTDLFGIRKFANATEYLKTLYQIARGIADIHKYGVIHRDIKPNNIKFGENEIIKIFDFGLSRFVGSSAETTGFKGTVGFAAPELYDAGKVSFTTAVDTFSFGALAWHLSEKSFPDSFGKIMPKMPAELNFMAMKMKIPEELGELLTRSVEEKPEARPMMADIRDALGRHLLTGKHRALMVSDDSVYEFAKVGQTIDLEIKRTGKIAIKYDGLRFKAVAVKGDVTVNDIAIENGHVFEGSSLITIGGKQKEQKRTYITFDVSHPEVVL